MKIAHILNELKFSGAEIMYVDAASYFQKKGCELLVVATAPKVGEFAPYFEREGYKVIHKPFPNLKNYGKRIEFYRKFIRFLKDENIDVVHVHTNGAMWGMALCAWMAGIKSVNTFHSIFPTKWYSHLYHCLLRWSAKNIFMCKFQSIGDSVHDHELKLFKNRTIKVRNWYGSNRYYPASAEEKEKNRNDLDIPKNAFVVISVGGCDENKRHHDIIKAMPLIVNQIPDLIYLHLGCGKTEEDEKRLSVDKRVSKYVRFCGNQRDVRKYLTASDVYLMTSHYEGISITTIEAMACKIPTILYDVPGLRDFNKKGENSILIKEDHTLLAEKIVYLYKHPEKIEEVTNNALAMVHEYYDMEKNVDQIYKLYFK